MWRIVLALAVVVACAAGIAFRLATGIRPSPDGPSADSPAETAVKEFSPEQYFVVVDQAPIRDAATGKPSGTLERGTGLWQQPDKKSFECVDPWSKPVTVEPNAALPAPEAHRFFGERLNARPNAEDYADRAATEMVRGAQLRALADLDRALELDPNLYRAWQRRAECRGSLALDAHDPGEARRLREEALRDAERCIQLRPDDVWAYLTRALLRDVSGNSSGALEDLNKGLELRPDYPPLYNNRAKLLAGLGRHAQALADLNRAIELSPEYSDAYTNRGIIYHHRREFDRAIEDATQAIRFNPRNVSAWNNRGTAYMETRQWEPAVADFDEVIRLKPNSSDGHFNRANLHFQHGTRIDEEDFVAKRLPDPNGARRSAPWFAKAVDDCDITLNLNPRDYKCFNTKGNAWNKLGKPREAIEVFDAALRAMAEESRASKLKLVDDDGSQVDAWEQVEKAMRFADNPEAFDHRTLRLAQRHPHRATIAAILGNRADAYRILLQDAENPDPSALGKLLADLTRAIIFDPTNAHYFRVRGYYNLEFKRYEPALSDLNRAVQLRPNYVEAIKGRVIATMNLQRFDEAWEDARELEKLGSPLDAPSLEQLKNASGRDK